jgi:outer membrane protein
MKAQILKTTLLVLLAIMASSPTPAQSQSPDSITLEQAIHLTLQNHPAVQQAKYAVAASEARVGTSRSPLYPNISFDGSYTRIGPVPQFDLPGEGPLNLAPYNNYDFHVGLHQTLYDFGRTSTSVRYAESQHQSADDYVDLVRSNFAYQTIATFNSILILHQTIAVVDEQIDALRQHLEVATKRIQAGTATDYDTLTTQVRIAVAQNDRIDAARALETQEVVFRQLTGLSPSRPITLAGSFSEIKTPPSPDSVLVVAEKQRPEMQLSKDAENSAVVQTQIASIGNKPSLGLDVLSGFKNGYEPSLNTLKGNFAAGFDLQVPLFNGHRAKYQQAEARANLEASRAGTSQIQRQIISEVNQAIAGVRSSLEKIKSSEVQMRQAEEALLMAKTRYEAGVITNLDLLDAQTTLSQVKLIRLRAFYDYTVSLSALDKATGRKVW